MERIADPRLRSLILITVDCLRADHCGFYGYSRPTTPFLDSLANESLVVPNAIVGGVPTYYSLPTVFVSRMPMSLGRDVIGIAPGESTLATALRDNAYATAAFSAGNPYISSRFGYNQGFDLFHDFPDFHQVSQADGLDLPHTLSVAPGTAPDGPHESFRGKLNHAIKTTAFSLGLGSTYNDLYFEYCMKIAPPATQIDALRKYPSADILVDQAQHWLGTIGPRPFFLWLHLMDPHGPYYPPNNAFRDLTGREVDPARARYLNEYWNRFDLPSSRFRKKRKEIIELYDAGIRWVDHQIARLVGTLKQSQLWDECVFALTADHGEEFLEHGGRFHAPVRLSEEVIRVPLLIRSAGQRVARLPSSPMSLLHLAPTLLDAVGVRAPSSFCGRSLWPSLQGPGQWTNPAIIECGYDCTNPLRLGKRNVPKLIAVRDEQFKLVMEMKAGAIEEIYDLKDDPGELHPLPGRVTGKVAGKVTSETRKELLGLARKHLQDTEAGQSRAAVLRLRSRLRDLRGEILGDKV